MDKLKPCPFCGGESYIRNPVGMYVCGCDKCRMSSALYKDREKAIEAWNRREEEDGGVH